MEPEEDINNFLAHYGVRGMKWGQRRSLNRKAKQEFYEKKANSLIEKASKNPNALFVLKTQTPHKFIVTGEEFMTHLSRGGLMDIRMTDIYAVQNKDGNYEVNPNINEKFRNPY